MADEQKVAEGTKVPKVPSGAMYIGLCQTRAQATILRWQYAVAFITLNGVVVTLCSSLFDLRSAWKMAGIAVILMVMAWFNREWKLLNARTNQWVDHYTTLLGNIEAAHGTESGVLVFSAEGYLSKSATDSLVRGDRFRAIITRLSTVTLALSCAGFAAAVLCAVYLAGQKLW